jgi:predicted phage terminase large subunit-like protein
MASKALKDAVQSYDKYLLKDGSSIKAMRKRAFEEQTMNAYTKACHVAIDTDKDLDYGLKLSRRVKNMLNDYAVSLGFDDIFKLEHWFKGKEELPSAVKYYYEILYLESPYLFDSYLLYLEKERERSRKFYEPRRNCLLKTGIVQALQDLEDNKLDVLSISMPPSTGKTTLEKFFQTWIIGRCPDDSNLFFSHSGEITRMYYDGIYDITTSNEYTWQEIFPEVKITNTNAKSEQINFGQYKPFPNVQCTSIGSANAGKVRCNHLLMCDDLIGGIEVALNKTQLDKLWDIYAVDARQRKMDGCKELHIATRWSVHDVIGRLKTAFENDDRARFIAIPDIDPETGKSNFEYETNGFSVAFFEAQAALMDDISYRCLYKNEPIEREGLLYHKEDLRTYLELPAGEPDAILGVCDTKNKGTDFLVMPVVYVYGADHYLVDAICDDSSDYGVQYANLANKICEHNMQQVEFESNNGGDRVAFEVEKKVKEQGGRCNITSKPTETNKETRIIVNADWIKKNVIFRDESLYTLKSDYGTMMRWLLSYSVTGKNTHDDVPDCMANYALFISRQLGAVATVVTRRFF